MSGSTDRMPRLLALVPWLLARPGARLRDVAAEFGINERELRRDLDLLFFCGLPGQGPGDLIDVVYHGDRVTLSNADAIARPLRLTADEALALVVALRALAGVPGVDATGALGRALAKVEQAAGAAAGPTQQVAIAVEAEAEGRVAAAVREAVERRRRVHLRYYVPGRDDATERDVDPMRLLVAGGQTYLEGWCRSAEDVRLFRLDRVLDVRVLDAAAEVPTDAEPRDLSAGLYRPSPQDTLVRLRLAPAARWVADYYACESVVEQSDGGVLVDLRTPDPTWVRRLALQQAGALTVLEPAHLAAEVRAAAVVALSGYGVAPDGP